jgi:hypothetical protein
MLRPLLVMLRLRLMLLRLVMLRLRLVLLRLILRLMLLLVVLWLVLLRLVMLRLVLLRLMVLLLRVERLLRRVWLTTHLRLVVALVIVVVGEVVVRRAAATRLLLEIRLGLAKLFLRGGDQAEIMLGVLIIIFAGNRIAGALRVAGELEIFFGDVRRRSPDFYVLPVGLVHSRQRILMMMMMATTFATIATAHAFVLTVSHDLLFRQPR